jgi:hypothetical protein
MNKTNNLVAELNNKVVKFDTSNSGKKLIVSANVVANGATFTSSANANFTGTLSIGGTNVTTTFQTKAIERSALANTNSFIKSQLANTNSFIKSQLANTNTFIATKTNTSTFNSALANTNSFIKSQLANTNTFIATKANSTNPTTSGLLAHTGRATISTNLTVSGNTIISGLVANGSLGTSNYALKTNGTSVYWGVVAATGGGGLGFLKLVRSSYTANTGDRVAANTKGGQFAVTLPSSPSNRDIVEIVDAENNFANTNLIISRNGSTIEGQSANLVMNISGLAATLQYDSSKSTWQVFTVSPTVSAVTLSGNILTGLTSAAVFQDPLPITTANTDIKGGTLLVTSNTNYSKTSTTLTNRGTTVLSGANTNITGGTLLVTSNTVFSRTASTLKISSNTNFQSNGSIKIPRGTTGQRPAPAENGAIRFNTTLNTVEAYLNGTWTDLASSGGAVPAGAIIYTALNFGAL